VKLRNIYFILLITVAGLPGTSPLHAQSNPAGTAKPTTSIEVEMVGIDNLTVPKEFQVSLYENLLQQMHKSSDFDMVYRDGNRNAQTSDNLVRMHSTITAFQEGSERARQVTTVKGATKIMVHCQFTDKQGTVLLWRDIEGQVRFFGNNLKATEDFAKKAAKAADEARELCRARPEHGGGA
jgi:hypothetical protein